MPSPFPGIDPFIEGQAVWNDFHPTFIATWRELLMRRISPGYVARLGQRQYLDPEAFESIPKGTRTLRSA